MVKIFVSTILGLSLLLSNVSGVFAEGGNVVSTQKTFMDVPESYWAAGYIKHMLSLHVIDGVDDLHFAPEDKVTRAEYVKMLMKIGYQTGILHENEKLTKQTAPFKDVTASDWFYESVVDAYNHGLLEAESKFRPNDSITREEMARLTAVLYNSQGGLPVNNKMPIIPFVDYRDIDQQTLNAVIELKELGIVDGKENLNHELIFDPQGYLTRAESVAVLSRLLDVVSNKKPANFVFKENNVVFTVTLLNGDLHVIADMGEKPTTGYAVKIIGIEYGPNHNLNIKYSISLPKEGEMQGQIVTHPKDEVHFPVDPRLSYTYTFELVP